MTDNPRHDPTTDLVPAPPAEPPGPAGTSGPTEPSTPTERSTPTGTPASAGTTAPTPDETPAPDDGPPVRRRRTAAVALLVAAALLVGAAGGAWFARRSPGDDSAEAGFARDMSTHHGQAVSMGTTVYGTSTDAQVRSLAIDIVLTQQAQIGMMQVWLESWDLPATGEDPPMAWMAHNGDHGGDHGDGGHGDASPARHVDPDTGLMPGMASPAQLAELRRLRGRPQHILFCQLMIVHHRAGIAMADAVLHHTDRREVRRLATAMRDGQESEIDALEDLLRRFGGPLPR